MTEASITINFADAVEVGGIRDLLILEQEEWADDTGKVKMSDFYNFTYNVLKSSTVENTVSCGLNADGSCTLIIYAYPKVPDLGYQLHTSYGSLSGRSNEGFDHQELITFNIAKKGLLSYFPNGRVSASWLGSVYDSAGNVKAQPVISVDEFGSITIPEKVYGTMKVEYPVLRHKYTLTVVPRESGTDMFGAVVYGLYTNGISWMNIDPPPDADALASGSVECGGLRLSIDLLPDEENDGNIPNAAPKVNRVITTDHCSQVVLSDVITYT